GAFRSAVVIGCTSVFALAVCGLRARFARLCPLGWVVVSASDAAVARDLPSSRPGLAVITVTYSPGEHLQRFIDTLATATVEKPQVILADNGSDDGIPELVAESNSSVRLLRTGGNIGYGGAINRAMAELDPDIEFVV